MKSSSTLLHQTFYPLHPPQDPTTFAPNKISISYPAKLQVDSIEPYHTLKLKKQQNIEKRPNFHNDYELTGKKKHPNIKNKLTTFSTKLKTEGIQNFTTQETQVDHYPNLMIKRSGSTAPIRNRMKSQTNKKNHVNLQEKITPETPDKQNLESVSSIFHYSNKSKHLKLSSLIRFRNKPHLIFCSSKLPKDFFGDSLDDQHHGHEYKFLPVNLNNFNHNSLKKLKPTSSVKLINELKNVENVQKLHFDEQKPTIKQRTNSKTEPEFTFRKQKSQKIIDIQDQNTHLKTPNFEQSRHFSPLKNSNENIQLLKTNTITYSEPRKKLNRKYSRQLLKL